MTRCSPFCNSDSPMLALYTQSLPSHHKDLAQTASCPSISAAEGCSKAAAVSLISHGTCRARRGAAGAQQCFLHAPVARQAPRAHVARRRPRCPPCAWPSRRWRCAHAPAALPPPPLPPSPAEQASPPSVRVMTQPGTTFGHIHLITYPQTLLVTSNQRLARWSLALLKPMCLKTWFTASQRLL